MHVQPSGELFLYVEVLYIAVVCFLFIEMCLSDE
jgi:hypothetical protein